MTDDDLLGDDDAQGWTEPDLEQPVEMLPPDAEEDEAAVDRFTGGVTRAIHRRLLGASIVELCIIGPAIVVVGLAVGFVGFRHAGGRGDERRGEDA